MNELKSLYEEYLKEYEKARSERKIGEGLFGFGKSLSKDACHERFVGQLEKYCAERFTGKITSDEAEKCLRFMLEYPMKYRGTPQLFWMFMAVQSFAMPLMEQLPAETAAKLEKEFSEKYPKWERFKAQKQILSVLHEKSAQCQKKGRRLW